MNIRIDSLSKSFSDRQQVLKGINYCDDIRTLSIIGPSGGGKSTLLRALGGLILPDSGTIWMDGEKLPNTEDELVRYRRNIGFVFQQGGLFRHMTGLENIIVPLVKVHGFSESAAKARAYELLERFGLTDEAYKRPRELSGGQQQRVAIARSIAPKPKILLLDEPTSALDPEYTSEILDMINELKQEDINFIIVTHELGFAWHACEKTAFLSDGVLAECGRSDEVFANPKTPQLRRYLSKLLQWNI